MSSLQKCLTIAEVCQMRDGEWVNEGVIARVSTIENKTAGPKAKKPGSKFWVVTLVAEDGPENVELSLFFAPKFREGDLIELTGKGIKFTQNNYGNKLSIGQETEITVVSNSTRERAPAPRSSAPQDDSRGGNGPAGTTYEPPARDDVPPANPHFHQKMSATALFYLHCLSYARKINTTLKATGHPEMSSDHFQACVSTLFIAGDRNGLAVAPPPSSAISPTPKPGELSGMEQAERIHANRTKVEPRKPAPIGRYDGDAEEDVPF